MDSPIVSLISIPIISFILLFLITKALRKNTTIKLNKLPPSPWKLPIIGNMHQLIGEHPHRRFQKLAQKYGPLFHLKLGEINLVVISSSHFVRDIFKTHDINFSSRPKLIGGKIIFYNYADVGLAPYGKKWSQLRKICTSEIFSTKRVKSFHFIREEEAENLVEKIRMAGGTPVNLSQLLLSISNTTVTRAVYGKGCAQQERFMVSIQKTFLYISGFKLIDLFPSWRFLGDITGLRSKMEKLHGQIDAILNEIIEEREAKYTLGDDKDLIDVLLGAKKNAGINFSMTMENVKGVILDLFLAGTHSVASVLEWAMTELIRNPMVMKKATIEVRKALNGKTKIIEDDMNNFSYINNVIKETLRLHPPNPLMVPRLCRETVELDGYTIPENCWVSINAWVMMRNLECWEDPESFRPERFEENAIDFGVANFEYFPFGGGRRICPGMSFGLANMECWLAHLLFYFDWKLPGGMTSQEVDMEEEFGLTLTKKNNLYLTATFNE